jgi:hypothetical protein
VEPRAQVQLLDHLSGESPQLPLRPAGEAPRHDLADPLLGVLAAAVGRVERPRDLRAGPGIGEVVFPSFPSEGLVRRGVDAPLVQEGVEQVLPHVAAPEGTVSVRGDDPPGRRACRALDADQNVLGALELHGGSITDRTMPSFD